MKFLKGYYHFFCRCFTNTKIILFTLEMIFINKKSQFVLKRQHKPNEELI